MKNLQHLQLFEAFESTKLSKTLGFIKEKKDKDIFLEKIKNICQSIDFPYSKLSDEFFDYLPFKSALKKSAILTDEPCEATSKSEFPQYAVAGEKCTKGKIKRQWGARTRDVVCPVCSGTGVKPKKSEVKLLKFWFNSEGKFIATTAVDGVIRKRSARSTGSKFSERLSDYIAGPAISHEQVKELPTGTILRAEIGGRDTVFVLFKEGNRIYAIQSHHAGSAPSSSSWRNYGTRSWALGNAEYRNPQVLSPKPKKTELKEEADPYEWNTGINSRYRSISIDQYADVKDQIKDAHFAIIMDFGKIKKSEFTTNADTQVDRQERKLGSKLDPNQSDESIKKKNIERYVNLLSQKLDISDDIANCNRLVTRSLGNRSALYIVYGTNIYSSLGNIIDYYIKFMGADDDRYKKNYADEITDRTNELFKSGMKRASQSEEIIKNIKSKLKSNSREEEYLKVLDLTQKLSDAIYNNIKNYQINDIEDLEVVAQKISSIRNILKSDRYGLNRYFGYIIEYISSGREDRAYSYLVDNYYTNVDEILEKMPRIIAIVSKI